MADLADIARGLERGLAGYLSQEQREREEERRRREEERRQGRFERERTLQEAEAARRGITLPGVERTRRAGPRAMVGDEELRLEQGAAPGLRTRPATDTPFLSGERGLFDRPPEGGDPMERAMAEELDAAASAPPGTAPDVEPGALDPETGQFVTEPVFRRPEQGPSVGRFLEEGRVEERGPEFRLSSGQRFEPGARERQMLEQEIDRVLQARPDLSRSEARLLLDRREDILTYGRGETPEGMDDTFNVRGRETRDLDEAVRWDEAFGGGRGTGAGDRGRSLTQTERVARQYGFDTVADFRRFQDRMGDLEQLYGNTQGDPLLQKALEARARGLSERQVMQRVVQDAREMGLEGPELEQVRADVTAFFRQRTRRMLGAMQSRDIGEIPEWGSGFDMEFEAPADTARGRGNARRTGAGGLGPGRQR